MNYVLFWLSFWLSYRHHLALPALPVHSFFVIVEVSQVESRQKGQVLQQQLQFEQQQLQQAFSTEMDSVMTTMKTYVEEYGKTKGYSFIFGTSDVTTTVMYGEDVSDISDAILKGLNEAYSKED